MPSLPIYDLQKKKVGSIELSDAIFAGEIRPHLLNDAVRAQIARRYEWRTANSLTRSEVHGTRHKMYKQKGTGQARHGDRKAPIFVGGGKAHGPKPRRVRFKINKKVMRKALLGALSLSQKRDKLFVIDKMEIEKPNTKTLASALKSFGVKKALIINNNSEQPEKNFNKSIRNIHGVKHIRPEGINVFDILKYENLMVSKKAIEQVTERFNNV